MASLLLPSWLIGLMTFPLLLAALVFWGGLVVIPLALLRALLPFAPVQELLSRLLVGAASQWVSSNRLVYRLMHAPGWNLDYRARLDPSRSYLLICNHQSWADIPILFDLFHRRTHFLRFFLKRELIWVPIVGLGCWALDMPFMKRHPREAIAANPALRDEDLQTTRRFCEKYRHRPITVVNFIEGTRFTPAKHRATTSPYRRLLRPKAAGLSFMLNAMGEQFGGLIDVTVAYRPTTRNKAWSWLCGEQGQLAIHVDTLPIPPELVHGDYAADAEFRARFQTWVNELWSRKDAQLERMLAQAGAAATGRARLT